MRTVTKALLILPVLLLASACAEPMEPDIEPPIEPTIEPYVEQLELSVDPIPGEIDTNVPKISGKVSDPGASVYVNDSKAMVIEDGTFFTYIEIPPRVPTAIEVRAESSTQEVSRSFTTTFYPRPFLWVTLFDARSDPAIMEGWVSYPEAQLHVEIGGDLQAEITGNLIDAVAAEIAEDGFFTAEFSLSELSEAGGYVRPGEDITRYDVTYRASTPRGIAGRYTIIGITTMNRIYRAPPYLNDSLPETMKVYAERGKTVLVDRGLRYRVPSPTTINLEIVPDPERGAISEDLSVSVEPKSLLVYPTASRNSTIIIRADDEVPSGSYFFNFKMWGIIEVVVE